MMRSHKLWLFIFSLYVALFLLGIGFAGPAGAQDDVEPTATPSPITDGTVSDTLTEALTAVTAQNVLEIVISMAVIFLIAFYGGKLLYAFLQKAARRTSSTLDNQLLEVIRPQISWFLLAVGFQFATARLNFLSESIQQLLQTSYFLLYLFVILATVRRAGDFLVDWYITGNKEKMNSNLVDQIVPVMKRLAHIVLNLIAVLISAAYFGVDILALSATLGLGGFALALAAKDSITNVISGFVIMVAQPFKVGDRIDVASLGGWGEVVDIGIRSSSVLMRDNRLVIVPNSAIVDNTVVNYSQPDSIYRLQSDIGVASDVDIPKTQKLIRETVRNVEGVLPDKPVDVWFTEFGDSSLTLRVRWWVPTYADKRRSTDRVNAAIQMLAKQDDIDLPNPTYTLENKFILTDEDIQRIAKAVKGVN